MNAIRSAVLLFAIIGVSSASYGVIFDAGSSGTRVFVLKWEKSSYQVAPIDSNYTFAIKPGLSPTSLKTMKEAEDYFGPLIRFAESKVPEEYQQRTPLYLKATGGVRLLDQIAAMEVIRRVNKVLSQSHFHYDPENSVKTISGIEEGLYGWVTINSIQDTLVSPHKTLGVLDLGGASTQISFVPKEAASVPKSLVSLKTGNFTHQIYIRSFLGFGINEARRKLETGLPLISPKSTNVTNPCLPKGYSRATHTNIMHGSSDFTGCKEHALKLLKKEDCISTNCSIAGMFQPPLAKTVWYARDHYPRVVHFLGLEETASIEEIEKAANQICKLNYKAYLETYHSEPENYCFEATYVATLLRDGFGFNTQARDIHFTDHVNGVETSWALGALLFELAGFSYSTHKTAEGLVDSTLASAAVMFFLLVIGIVGLAKTWLPRPRSRSFSKKSK